MLDIAIDQNVKTKEYNTVSSDEVSYIVCPCSTYEKISLYRSIVDFYQLGKEEIILPEFLPYGQRKYHIPRRIVETDTVINDTSFSLEVYLEVWKIRKVSICFVEPASDVFVLSITKKWLEHHFKCAKELNAIFNPLNFQCIIYNIAPEKFPVTT